MSNKQEEYLETIRDFENKIEKAIKELREMESFQQLETTTKSKRRLEGYIQGMTDAYLILTGVDYIPVV